MDLSYKQEVTVGSLVILAIVLFIVGTSWLSGRSVAADSDEWWKIQFKDAGNLKTSSPVKISGVAVGKVERIRLLDPGKVLVEVSLPEKITPRVDAGAQIVAVGFVGDAAVQFESGRRAGEAVPRPGHHREPGGGPQRPGGEPGRPGRQRPGRGPGDREPEDGRPALRHDVGAAGHPQGGPAHHARSTATRSNGPTAQLTRTLETLERMTARLDSTLANPGLAAGAHPRRLADRQPGRHDGAAGLDRRPARHPAAQDQPGPGHPRQVRHRLAACTTTSGRRPSR